MAGHTQDHDFYIPGNSYAAPITCLGLGVMAFGFVTLMHFSAMLGKGMLLGGLVTMLLGMGMWFSALIREARARGFKAVPRVLDLANRYGMVFFIVSEVMFFAAFFAAYFYASNFNVQWPPANVEIFEVYLPIFGTLILLTSGATITFAHHDMVEGRMKTARNFTMATWALGFLFLCFQMYEYSHAAFAFDSGIFGSLFYLLTGFHGFHVLVGAIMILVAWKRMRKGDFTPKHHFYYEAAAWYWHFVDVVWLGLFLFVYLIPGMAQ